MVISVVSIIGALVMDRIYLAVKKKHETINELRFIRDFAHNYKSLSEFKKDRENNPGKEDISKEEKLKLLEKIENSQLKLKDFIQAVKTYKQWFPTAGSVKDEDTAQALIEDANNSIVLIQEYGVRKANRILNKPHGIWKRRGWAFAIGVLCGAYLNFLRFLYS